jgi:polyphenol oxidase
MIKVIFGNSHNYSFDKNSQSHDIFLKIITDFNLKNFTVLSQVHSIKGHCIEKIKNPLDIFSMQGDFLITQQKNIGIGVLTADCLPVVVFDPITQTAGIAHSGWKGTSENIAYSMNNTMKTEYSVSPKNIKIWLGPAAKQCCYEVDKDFYKNFEHFSFYQKCFFQRNKKKIFDNGLLSYLILQENGIPEKNIDTSHHVCTICNEHYHSYRRNKTLKRNISFIILQN